jgi:Right handed beta helix region
MATNRYLKPGLVVALAISLMLAGIAFASPLLHRSRVAVTCANTGLAQNAQSHRFAGPSQHRPCSGPRHERGLDGRVAVTQVPEISMPVPPVNPGETGTASPVAVENGSPVAQPPSEGQPPEDEPPGEEAPGEGEPPGEEAPQDTTPPETSISAKPASMTGSTSAKLFFAASEEGSSFECELDGGGWSSCSSPTTYAGLSLGSHQFSVRAKDPAGNVDATPAAWQWTIEDTSEPEPPVDNTPPQTSIVRGPAKNTTSTVANFALSSTESESTFDCNLDSGGWESCAATPTYSELEAGEHKFSARAIDTTGNVDPTPVARDWTIEEPPPPPGEIADCTTTVTSTSAARSAVSTAAVGAVVCLANGSYGEVTINAKKAAPGVTLRAQNPGQATIEGATVGGSHLTLARFVITNGVSIPGGTLAPTIEHNRITGGGQGIDACTTTTEWCTEERIVGNQLIGPFGEDAIHANRYHGLYVEGNEITQVRENGAHSDCLQTVWRGDHIYFKRNYLHDNRCQGFFIKDQTMSTPEIPGGPIEGVVVEDNLFLRNKEPCGPPATSCGQPIYFQPVAPFTGFVMKRNTIWGDGADSIAAFRGEGAVGSDTLVEDNVIYRIWTDWNMTAATLRNNTDCLRETSGAGAFSTVTGETKACSLSFANTAADDYRIAGERGVDWAPAEVHFGP